MTPRTAFFVGCFVGGMGFYLTLLALSVPSAVWLP